MLLVESAQHNCQRRRTFAALALPPLWPPGEPLPVAGCRPGGGPKLREAGSPDIAGGWLVGLEGSDRLPGGDQ